MDSNYLIKKNIYLTTEQDNFKFRNRLNNLIIIFTVNIESIYLYKDIKKQTTKMRMSVLKSNKTQK